MTNKDIYRNLGGIDPELIVEASKKRRNNGYGRVVKWASLAACIAIIVTAIPVTLILNREDSKAPAVTTPVEDIVVTPGREEEENKSLNVIYCDSLMMKKEGLIQNAFNDKNVEIRDIDGNLLDAARHPKQIIVLDIDFKVNKNDMIRLVINK